MIWTAHLAPVSLIANPGDIGFDPLGLKPKTKGGFKTMVTKEIQNECLAMFGAIGMLVQEQITYKPIVQTLKPLF